MIRASVRDEILFSAMTGATVTEVAPSPWLEPVLTFSASAALSITAMTDPAQSEVTLRLPPTASAESLMTALEAT